MTWMLPKWECTSVTWKAGQRGYGGPSGTERHHGSGAQVVLMDIQEERMGQIVEEYRMFDQAMEILSSRHL